MNQQRGSQTSFAAAPPAGRPACDLADRRGGAIHPLTLATVWHSLQRICREMRHVIERTSQSYLISQLKDISVGIWDGAGNTIAIPGVLAIQFVGAKYSGRYILEEYKDNV